MLILKTHRRSAYFYSIRKAFYHSIFLYRCLSVCLSLCDSPQFSHSQSYSHSLAISLLLFLYIPSPGSLSSSTPSLSIFFLSPSLRLSSSVYTSLHKSLLRVYLYQSVCLLLTRRSYVHVSILLHGLVIEYYKIH